MTQYGRTNERDNTTEVVHHKVERERHRTLLHSHIHTLQYHTYIQVREIRTDAQYITYSQSNSLYQSQSLTLSLSFSLSLSQPLTLTSTSPTPGTIVVLTALSSSASVRTNWVVNAVSLLAADLVVSDIFNATNIV